ncbi:hypothetical protein JMJ58_14850 [Haloterrigena salifodinae]|uniref:Uncharacterized protein n=1 Tax=Haloterrigena salifodinae TaxID=2675099 RepID=A0A8T8DXZ6_9EURY|nr:hypothetical protein [Haloterrigena salifodinae]QRV14212.1 hypothetical protein JMJ58_14850 [Haloterrigena salifodinae]
MSTNGDYYAQVQDVRDELHADGWDPTGLSDEFIIRRLERRASPIVKNELADGNPEWKLPILEALLAGHYILASGNDDVRQVNRESNADGSGSTYQGDIDQQGLRGTTLGQQAIEEDDSGVLADRAATVDDPEDEDPFWFVSRSA